MLVKDYTYKTTTLFKFQNIMTRFKFPIVLMSDQAMYIINYNIRSLNQEFMIHHQNISPYHSQVNDTMEEFNKILKHALTKICNYEMDDWDEQILAVLWAYRTK